MTRASTFTHLKLSRFAELMNLNPLTFAGASAAPLAPCKCEACVQQWVQHPYQCIGSGWSREELARAIQSAECSIGAELGISLCPEQACKVFEWQPSCWNDPVLDLGECAFNWGERHIEEIGQLAVVANGEFQGATGPSRQVIDPMGTPLPDEFWPALFTLQLPIDCSAKACELKLFHAGRCGEPTWEICTASTRVIEEQDGCTAEFVIHGWELVRPELYDEWPDCSDRCPTLGAIDLLNIDNYVEHVSVCREYYAQSEPTVEFLFYGDSKNTCGCDNVGCGVCSTEAKPGCWRPEAHSPGLIKAHLADYSEAAGEWCAPRVDCCCDDGQPDAVRVHYWAYAFAGWCDNVDPCGLPCPPVELEEAIAEMAAARLDCRDCCTCGSGSRISGLQADLAFTDSQGGHNVSFATLENPFGSRRGELSAWRKVQAIKQKLQKAGCAYGANRVGAIYI